MEHAVRPNRSPRENSQVTGKIQGISTRNGRAGPQRPRLAPLFQGIGYKFPTHSNREFGSRSRVPLAPDQGTPHRNLGNDDSAGLSNGRRAFARSGRGASDEITEPARREPLFLQVLIAVVDDEEGH